MTSVGHDAARRKNRKVGFMAFSLAVEMLNLRLRGRGLRQHQQKQLNQHRLRQQQK